MISPELKEAADKALRNSVMLMSRTAPGMLPVYMSLATMPTDDPAITVRVGIVGGRPVMDYNVYFVTRLEPSLLGAIVYMECLRVALHHFDKRKREPLDMLKLSSDIVVAEYARKVVDTSVGNNLEIVNRLFPTYWNYWPILSKHGFQPESDLVLEKLFDIFKEEYSQMRPDKQEDDSDEETPEESEDDEGEDGESTPGNPGGKSDRNSDRNDGHDDSSGEMSSKDSGGDGKSKTEGGKGKDDDGKGDSGQKGSDGDEGKGESGGDGESEGSPDGEGESEGEGTPGDPQDDGESDRSGDDDAAGSSGGGDSAGSQGGDGASGEGEDGGSESNDSSGSGDGPGDGDTDSGDGEGGSHDDNAGSPGDAGQGSGEGNPELGDFGSMAKYFSLTNAGKSLENWKQDDVVSDRTTSTVLSALDKGMFNRTRGPLPLMLRTANRFKVDTTAMFKKFMSSTDSEDVISTWSRRNRKLMRHGMLAPGYRYEDTQRILFCIDVSGSMYQGDAIAKCMNVMENVVNGLSIDIVYWDAVCSPVFTTPKSIRDMAIYGGGFTDPDCVLKKLGPERFKYDGLVFLTDCVFTWPEPPKPRQIMILRTHGTAEFPDWCLFKEELDTFVAN